MSFGKKKGIRQPWENSVNGLIQRTWESLEGKKNKLALMSFDFVFKVVNFDTFGISLH